ncbi:hypothetical protein K439DRAFT_1614921 [Ramaria rubella]|nr:hypothetical protein K439DRAFT_1614921 [Ramaria rubella]
MNMRSYVVQDEIQASLVSDTTTDANYARYICNYEFWWAKNEAVLCNTDPTCTAIPAMPIMAGKVTLFLDYEIKRPKRKCGSGMEFEEGTTVGSSVIRGAAHLPLRSDDCIKRAEAAVKHNEPERVAKSQTLKAVGSSSDTYTTEELISVSRWCMIEPRTRNTLGTYLRDCAMHLMSTATAFHGDNVRELGISDLFTQDVPNISAGYKSKIMSLHILVDNAKHNQNSKIEEQGAIRHCIPALCAIGALAMHFFSLFHMTGQSLRLEPDFSVEAHEARFGEFGHCEWYAYKAFFASDIMQTMSYTNHSNRVKLMHEKTNIAISKVTHAGCVWSALIMRQYGTSVADTKAIGLWSAAGAFDNCYDQELPLEGLLGACLMLASQKGTFLHEICLDRTAPWTRIRAVSMANPKAMDLALESFLHLLINLRRILIQDLAVLYHEVPTCLFYFFPPFNSPAFHKFAEQAPAKLEEAEAAACAALQNLPEHMAQTLQGVVQTAVAAQQEQASTQETQFESLEHALLSVQGQLGLLIESPPWKCTKIMAYNNTSTVAPPPSITPPTPSQMVHNPPSLPSGGFVTSVSLAPSYSPGSVNETVIHEPSPCGPTPALASVPETLVSPFTSAPSQEQPSLEPVSIVNAGLAPALTTIISASENPTFTATHSVCSIGLDETQRVKSVRWAQLTELYGDA